MPDAEVPAAFRFVLAALATWRITHLVVEEDGPADAIVRLRARVGDGAVGRAMDCFYCFSLWAAAPLALFVADGWLSRGVSWIALSGAACLAERVTDRKEGGTSELLRREAARPGIVVDRAGARHDRAAAGAARPHAPRLPG